MKKAEGGRQEAEAHGVAERPPRGRGNAVRQPGRAAFLVALTAIWGACSPTPEPTAVDEAASPDAPTPGVLDITPLYAADGPEAERVTFSVYDGVSEERVHGPTRATRFGLEAGRYRVEAALGAAEAYVEADVRAGEVTRETLVLGAGVLNLSALLDEEGDEAPRPTFTILGVERDLRGDRATVAGPSRGTTFVLPEGDLLVRVASGAVTVEDRVTVRAGERTEATIVLDAGMLQAGARREDGAALRVTWDVQSGQADIRGEREQLAGPSRGETWSILLPGGEHLLRARHGDQVREKPLVIEAGARTEVDIVFPVED